MILFRPSLIVYYRMGCIWAPPSKTFQTLRLLLSASWAISLLCFLQSSMWLSWLCPEVMWELYRTSVPFSAASACLIVSSSPRPGICGRLCLIDCLCECQPSTSLCACLVLERMCWICVLCLVEPVFILWPFCFLNFMPSLCSPCWPQTPLRCWNYRYAQPHCTLSPDLF